MGRRKEREKQAQDSWSPFPSEWKMNESTAPYSPVYPSNTKPIKVKCDAHFIWAWRQEDTAAHALHCQTWEKKGKSYGTEVKTKLEPKSTYSINLGAFGKINCVSGTGEWTEKSKSDQKKNLFF